MQVSFNIWDVLINLVFSYIATVGFALTVNIPHRVIHWSGICGCAGWMVYWLVTEASGGRMISNTLGAFAVGLVAVVLAKGKSVPSPFSAYRAWCRWCRERRLIWWSDG